MRNMSFILISGDGEGAGKTTFARRLESIYSSTMSLADGIRRELRSLYPDIRWFNKSQEYKSNTYLNGKSVRQHLIDVGQSRREDDPDYWCKKLYEFAVECNLAINLDIDEASEKYIVIVDDVRFKNEVSYLREHAGEVIHYHITNPNAKTEPIYDNNELKQMADYVVQWRHQ